MSPTTGNDLYGDIERRKKAAEKQGIKFDISGITIEIPSDVYIENTDTQIIRIDEEHHKKYARTPEELKLVFDNFLLRLLRPNYEKVSVPRLRGMLFEYMEWAFGLMEWDAIKVILYYRNRPIFEELISKALEKYLKIIGDRRREETKREYKKYEWEVPAERFYNAKSNQAVPETKNHALEPFVRLIEASNPEVNFEKFLESNSDYIEWWYKNGDEGMQHYAIPYMKDDGASALFYPDFVIRMRNGQIFLFDTKSPGSDLFAVQKHNALIQYINEENSKGKNLKGGILIQAPNSELWRYSPLPIDTTENTNGWDAFHPIQYR